MSRGLGRIERELLARLHDTPHRTPSGRRYIWIDECDDLAGRSTLYRAARSLHRKGFTEPVGHRVRGRLDEHVPSFDPLDPHNELYRVSGLDHWT